MYSDVYSDVYLDVTFDICLVYTLMLTNEDKLSHFIATAYALAGARPNHFRN